MNNQSQDPWKTLVLSDCILVAYVPLRLERSESVSKMVFSCTFLAQTYCLHNYLYKTNTTLSIPQGKWERYKFTVNFCS